MEKTAAYRAEPNTMHGGVSRGIVMPSNQIAKSDQQPLLSDVHDRIMQAISRIGGLTAMTRDIADGLVGPAPAAESSSNNSRPTPSGRVWLNMESANALHSYIDELASEIDRLRRV